jgi:GMP synthase (glutamine-hydrolysing)
MSARHDAPRGRVLVVLHQEHSCPARIGRLLHTMGYELDARRPRFGDPLPDTLAHHAGAIIFGGPMSVNDPDEWLRREIDFVGVALKENAPLLGVCLGGQMIAKHLGVRVAPHRKGLAEIGYYPIAPTQAGHSICAAPFPEHVYQWHFEGFELPPGADLLARGTTFENQAFRFGSAVGLQFHPEVTYATICRWTTRAAHRMESPGAQERCAHIDGWYAYDAAIARWIDSFLHRWIGRSEGALIPAGPQAPILEPVLNP